MKKEEVDTGKRRKGKEDAGTLTEDSGKTRPKSKSFRDENGGCVKQEMWI